MEKGKNIIFWFARISVALLFIFSGLIKLNDPIGFSYKLEEYFEVFHLVFLNPFSVLISIFLCALEVILGLFLIAGLHAKKVVLGLLLLIVFFTFLTFYSAYFEVVKTCGCFGDAIPLSPWQSFSKDLVLFLFIVYIFINKNNLRPIFYQVRLKQYFSILAFITPILFGLYTYTFLPIIDFLPYHIGADIPKSAVIPGGAAQNEYQINYTLKNKKTGEQKIMTDKEYLKTKIYENPDWELISSSDPILVNKGFEPKIKDLNIYDSQGVNYTAEIFENPYYNLVVVAWDLPKANKKAIGDLNAIAINAAENFNIRTSFLTTTSGTNVQIIVKKMNLIADIFYADAVPLKSMIRSNPGLMLLKNGVVIDKWPSSALPNYQTLAEKYFSAN
jgi:uncharacterized membrane protein YphA (DoxX/SURF4 family)